MIWLIILLLITFYHQSLFVLPYILSLTVGFENYFINNIHNSQSCEPIFKCLYYQQLFPKFKSLFTRTNQSNLPRLPRERQELNGKKIAIIKLTLTHTIRANRKYSLVSNKYNWWFIWEGDSAHTQNTWCACSANDDSCDVYS